MNGNRHRRPSRRASAAALALFILSIGGAGVASAAANLDFGTVSVGAVKSLSTTVPLQGSLSELPPGTVLYGGGNPTLDFALSIAGLSVPVTAASLYAVTGEITATYHLSPLMEIGVDFTADAGECFTGTVSCTASFTFSPTHTGPHTTTVHWEISDLQVTGGGGFESLISLMADFIGASFVDQMETQLTGIGVPTTGTVAAQVNIAASAACIELSTSAIDFGNLSLGAEDAPAGPTITITNCSGVGETLYAAGTDADGISSHWSLVDSTATCGDTLGLDNYRLMLASPSFGGPLSLSTSNKTAQSLAPAEATEHTARIFTACPGSTGAGRVMTMFINYLVTGE